MGSLFLPLTIILLVTSTGAPVLSIPFKTIAMGEDSGIRTPIQVVVRTPAAWRALWQKHTSGQPQSALPTIDFSRDMVVAVFAGDVPPFTRASILRISREGSRLTALVRIAQARPGPVPTEPGNVTPYHIVRLPRSGLPVVFVRGPDKEVFEPGR